MWSVVKDGQVLNNNVEAVPKHLPKIAMGGVVRDIRPQMLFQRVSPFMADAAVVRRVLNPNIR